MRDDQVRRYSRHIRLHDVGGLGQTALMVSTAKLVLRESEPRAEMIAASYLVAGGVGALVLAASSEAQQAAVASHGPDTKVLGEGGGREVTLRPRPAWWPGAPGDDTALAYWRGAIAATAWMADALSR